MFTGLVQNIGMIRSIDGDRGDLRLEIATDMDLSNTQIGASICCSGCCLTVIEKTSQSFCVDVSAETLSKTILGTWVVGTEINLEPSLKAGDEIMIKVNGQLQPAIISLSGEVKKRKKAKEVLRDNFPFAIIWQAYKLWFKK